MILQCSAKIKSFKFVAVSLCTAVVLWTLGAQSSTGTIVLAQGITRADSAEQASRSDTSDEGDFDLYSIASGVLLVVGATCVFVAIALFFARKWILCSYGWGTGLIGWLDPFIDHRSLREIAQTQAPEEQRSVFTWINVLIPTLLIGAIDMMLLAVLLSELGGNRPDRPITFTN